MDGKEMRLKRLLARSGKLVIAAMDHGGFMGPTPGLDDPDRTCAELTKADGVLMMPGMVPRLARHFVSAASPVLLVRVLWNSAYCLQRNTHESRHASMLTVAEAVGMGADAVLASLGVNSASEGADAENAGLFCRCVQQARELGVPMVGEIFPAGAEEMPRDELHVAIRTGCRMIAELGADLIKTFYTGERFHEVVASTPIPILVLGAEKTPAERDALQLALSAAQAGARGIVFGRNIFQSRNPAGFITAVRAVMNGESGIEEALKAHGLE